MCALTSDKGWLCYCTTDRSSTEIMLRRQPRSQFHLLKPNMAQIVEQKQLSHDKSSATCEFQEGKELYAHNFFNQGSHWLADCIISLTGLVSIVMELEDSCLIRQHFDQIHKKFTSTSEKILCQIQKELIVHLCLCHIDQRTVHLILRLILVLPNCVTTN